MTRSETTSEPSNMPMAGGSLKQRWLTQPISAASASTMAKRSTGPSPINVHPGIAAFVGAS